MRVAEVRGWKNVATLQLLAAVVLFTPCASGAQEASVATGRPVVVWASDAFLDLSDRALPSGGQRGLNGKGALVGASVGLVIGGVVGVVLDDRHLSTHGPLLPKTAAAGAIFGGLLGAGGGAAWKGAGLGLLVGVGVGAIAAVSNGEAGLAPLVLGGTGAAAGVVLGALMGMTSRRDSTPEGSQDRVHVSVAPYGSGFTVGASIAL
jgi:hypothetical protein